MSGTTQMQNLPPKHPQNPLQARKHGRPSSGPPSGRGAGPLPASWHWWLLLLEALRVCGLHRRRKGVSESRAFGSRKAVQVLRAPQVLAGNRRFGFTPSQDFGSFRCLELPQLRDKALPRSSTTSTHHVRLQHQNELEISGTAAKRMQYYEILRMQDNNDFLILSALPGPRSVRAPSASSSPRPSAAPGLLGCSEHGAPQAQGV